MAIPSWWKGKRDRLAGAMGGEGFSPYDLDNVQMTDIPGGGVGFIDNRTGKLYDGNGMEVNPVVPSDELGQYYEANPAGSGSIRDGFTVPENRLYRGQPLFGSKGRVYGQTYGSSLDPTFTTINGKRYSYLSGLGDEYPSWLTPDQKAQLDRERAPALNSAIYDDRYGWIVPSENMPALIDHGWGDRAPFSQFLTKGGLGAAGLAFGFTGLDQIIANAAAGIAAPGIESFFRPLSQIISDAAGASAGAGALGAAELGAAGAFDAAGMAGLESAFGIPQAGATASLGSGVTDFGLEGWDAPWQTTPQTPGGLPQLPPTPNLPGTNSPTLPTVPGSTVTIPPGWTPEMAGVAGGLGGTALGNFPGLPGLPRIPGIPGTGTGGNAGTGGGAGGFDWTSFLLNAAGSGGTAWLNRLSEQERMRMGQPARDEWSSLIQNPSRFAEGPLGNAMVKATMQGRSAMAPGGTQDIMNAAGALGGYNQYLGVLGQLGNTGLNQAQQFGLNFNQLPSQIAGAAGAASGPSARDWFDFLRGGSGVLGGGTGGTGGPSFAGLNSDEWIDYARTIPGFENFNKDYHDQVLPFISNPGAETNKKNFLDNYGWDLY